MIGYLLQRLVRIPLVLIASFVPAFLLVHAAPNGPFDPARTLPEGVEAMLSAGAAAVDRPTLCSSSRSSRNSSSSLLSRSTTSNSRTPIRP